jgi:hypothetical protein
MKRTFWLALIFASLATLLASCAKGNGNSVKGGGMTAGQGHPISAAPDRTAVTWAGHSLQEIRSLDALPPALQTILGTSKQGLDGIAEPNGKYNATDFVDGRLPMRRFLVAGLDQEMALVAVEHGGYAWRVEVTQYSLRSQTPAEEKSWTTYASPQSLRELVATLPPR